MSIVEQILFILLGAAIAFGTTWFFAWRAEKDRKLGLGYELFFEVQTATETICEIRRVLTANIELVGQQHREQHWQSVQIPTGFDWSRRWMPNPAGLAVLASAKKFELINQLMELARLHDLLLIITAEYALRQERLTERLREGASIDVSGSTVGILITQEATARHAPDMLRVEDLVRQLLAKAIDGVPFAQDVAQRLGSELQEALRDRRFRGSLRYEKVESQSASKD
ncbi:MAG: hypothetical protein GC206_14205 [Alphaproteobacteria bacterium]|nr:hypothetical protein [Alphaproteobacteria bacterium]